MFPGNTDRAIATIGSTHTHACGDISTRYYYSGGNCLVCDHRDRFSRRKLTERAAYSFFMVRFHIIFLRLMKMRLTGISISRTRFHSVFKEIDMQTSTHADN